MLSLVQFALAAIATVVRVARRSHPRLALLHGAEKSCTASPSVNTTCRVHTAGRRRSCKLQVKQRRMIGVDIAIEHNLDRDMTRAVT